MLKIGEFSKLSRISVRMLRHFNRVSHPIYFLLKKKSP